ncbi:MAG: Flp pilus assembly complex ATPase component TadA [Deltaproteobacteria bacterium]|nr:Flp pilus assembly complex ATPase component TadA [Deltaproteobacteria bacterium]
MVDESNGKTSKTGSIPREKIERLEATERAERVRRTLGNAQASKEMGLYHNAVREYEKLMEDLDGQDSIWDLQILYEYLGALLEVHDPRQVIEKAGKVIETRNLSSKDAAKLYLWLGNELEKRGHPHVAMELYGNARRLDPNNREVFQSFRHLKTRFSNLSRYEYLLRKKLVTVGQLQDAKRLSKETNKSVETILIEQYKIEKREIGKSLSLFYGCPFRDFRPELPVPVELMGKLKKTFLLHYSWVPISWSKEGIEVLVDDPNDLQKTDYIKAIMTTSKIRFSVGIKEDIIKYIEAFYQTREEKKGVNDLLDNLKEIVPDVSFEEEEEQAKEVAPLDESSSLVVKLVDQILITAFRKKASDIHIEPSPVTTMTTIRYRIDGVCHEHLQIPNAITPALISRLKIMANLDIAERRLPQDGKIKIRRKGIEPFEVRLSTMPTTGGHQDAVLRILSNLGAMKLADMGLSERNYRLLKKSIVKPYGMILVVGPTGSGKTTTLHAALAFINKPSIKIWTAEDPVEITQPGLRQVEINSRIGLNFARALRGFLRLDPDVIMIGEMRDQETASIALEAALTGHLVFSTLHTNNAPETITRIIDMGLNPLNFSDALLCVLAQRLARRLCENCKKLYRPSENEFRRIVDVYGEEDFGQTRIKYGPNLNLYRADGCEKCEGTGYKNRVGIYELMEGTRGIKKLVKSKATTEELLEQAKREGMTTLKQDGVLKVFQGITDINEVDRVCIE